MRRSLRRALAGENCGDRSQQNLQVEARRPVIDVIEVELHPAIEVNRVAAADLPETRQSRFHRKAPAMPPVIRRDFLRNGWPRSDETHVALEHVPELRDLVERELAQPAADAGDARIAVGLEDRSGHLVEMRDLA